MNEYRPEGLTEWRSYRTQTALKSIRDAVPRDRTPEIVGLTLASESPGSIDGLLRWEKNAAASQFNVYRTPALPSAELFACLRDRIRETV
jgi:hypothetical protein